MKVNIKRLHENATIPFYAKESDAGMDLVITDIKGETEWDISYGFGISMEIPDGFMGLVFPRSSIRKTDLILSNSVGVIDAGYRGEIQATFKKTGGAVYKIGDRGAQLIIIPHPIVEWNEVNELNNTERGEGGFGSTGK
jgi:dUTP pyrophosphatase